MELLFSLSDYLDIGQLSTPSYWFLGVFFPALVLFLFRSLYGKFKRPKYELHCQEKSVSYSEVKKKDKEISIKKYEKAERDGILQVDETQNTNEEDDNALIIVKSRIRITNNGKEDIGNNENSKLKIYAPYGFEYEKYDTENVTQNITINKKRSLDKKHLEFDWHLLKRGYGFDVVTESSIPKSKYEKLSIDSFYDATQFELHLPYIEKISKGPSLKERKRNFRKYYALSVTIMIITLIRFVLFAPYFKLHNKDLPLLYDIEISQIDSITGSLYNINNHIFSNGKGEPIILDSIITNICFEKGSFSYSPNYNIIEYKNDSIMLNFSISDFDKVKINSANIIQEKVLHDKKINIYWYIYSSIAVVLILILIVPAIKALNIYMKK